MITHTKVRQLEKRFIRSPNGTGPFVVHDVTEDGRLLDKESFVMTDEEVKLVKEEDNEIDRLNGKIILVTQYSYPETGPKLKSGSATVPYHVRPDYGAPSGKTWKALTG